MNKSEIAKAMENEVSSRGCFIVDIEVSRDNDITLTIEKKEGIVEMDDCVQLSDAFHAIFNQDEEDYSLTVSSAGLDQPFKVAAQFEKAIGTPVTVRLRDSRKLTGTLKAYSPDGLTLSYQAREAVDGKKKKVLVDREETFPLDSINSVIPYITFE